jgi:N-acetylmuramoyl-L-alanine amidase/FlgD Ig-like domain
MKPLLAILAATLVAPASALAGGPTLTMREVPLHTTRTIAAATPQFNLVGLHWRGSGTVLYRTRSAAGRWRAWRAADDDDVIEHAWHFGNLSWVDTSNGIRFQTRGRVSRLRAYYVWSPVERLGTRRLQIANAPPIIPRLSWGADESIRRAAPMYTSTISFAIVHHTAGSNNYTRAQSAAIVRGIFLYHVQGNGWNDIGYNLLVDKYGQVFEGRYGGVDRNVIGAHSEGFNTGSVGVSVLGDYSNTQLPAAAKASLEQVLAWRLDLAHIDPQSLVNWTSGGNPKYPRGVSVPLRAIAGHRDTGFTDCPGNALYALLPQIARDVAALGGPKIYAPAVARNGEGQWRFTGRVSTGQPWTVTIVNSSGAQVAQGAGTGTTIDWTWDASLAPADRYTWTMAVPNARSATGAFGAAAALAVQKTAASPAAIAPGETTTVSYTLTAPATVTATLVGPNGQALSTLLTAQKPAGSQTLAFTPPAGLANGQYAIALSATSGSKVASASVPFVLDDILGAFSATGPTLSYTLTRAPVSVAFQVLDAAGTAVSVQAAPPPVAGPQVLTWDGTLTDGAPAPDGSYVLALTVSDEFATFTRTAPLTLDRTSPVITVVSYRNLRFRISEPATLTLVVGANRYTRTLKKAATTQFWLRKKPAAYRLIARDAAGNSSVVRYRR